MFKKSFTLAEVLLALAIIGVVAALTIPNLASNYQDEHTVVKLKQIKNDLDLAYQKKINKYGEELSFDVDGEIDVTEEIERFVEFLDVTQIVDGKYELKDGTYLNIIDYGEDGILKIEVLLGGPNGNTNGKNIFGFELKPLDGFIEPYGAGNGNDNNEDKFSKINNDFIYATNWAIHMGNLDYLKCADELNWETKRTCD